MKTFQMVGDRLTIDKDPSDQLDYVIGFTDWLASIGDTIASIESATGSKVTLLSSAVLEGNKIVLWVSGGELGDVGSVRVVMVTTGTGATRPRKKAFTVYFKLAQG